MASRFTVHLFILIIATSLIKVTDALPEQRGRPGIAPNDPDDTPRQITNNEKNKEVDDDDVDDVDEPKYNSTCRPKSYPTYPWFRAGENVWYLESSHASRWFRVAMDCIHVEPGRSTIATVRSDSELEALHEKLPSASQLWLGGIRLGLPVWHWYTNKGDGGSLKTIKKFFWKQGEPNGAKRIKKCLLLDGQDGWADRFCWIAFRGLCEFRCLQPDDPNNLK